MTQQNQVNQTNQVNAVFRVLMELEKIDKSYPLLVARHVYWNEDSSSWRFWAEDYADWFDYPDFKTASFMFVHYVHDLEGNVPPAEILEVTRDRMG